ncbi:MAG TPA: hypothetical protein VHX59_16385 [Mycobacteriales bacterium]|jgi:hypothetical protein|nr:hypothetical protein [Mycobacteriales bacterium]
MTGGTAASNPGSDANRPASWVFRVGIIGLLLSIVCGAVAFAALSPALNTSDEIAHLDYAYQVWHGQLPVFEHGLLFRPPVRNIPPVQWEAQHPPLFYLLAAPIVGPLINGGHWLAATMAGRGLCVLIAAACVLALSWAGSLVSTRRRVAWAITVPAVVSPVALFMRVGGSFYLDNLATFFTALALGISILSVRYGVTLKRTVIAAVLAAAGMLTDASFAVTVLVAAGALGLAVLMHDGSSRWVRIGRSVAIGVVPVLAAGAASGWFYLRNKHLTGNYTGSHPVWSRVHLHRVTFTFWHVATSSPFWKGNLELFRQGGGALENNLGPILLAVTVGCAVIGWLLRLLPARRKPVNPGLAAVGLVLFMQALGTVISEIGFTTSGGSINTRYLLPALLPLGCLLAAGILALPRKVRAPALAVFLVITWGFFVRWAWTQPVLSGSRWSGRTVNHVPSALVLTAFVGLAVGVLAQAVALAAATDSLDRSDLCGPSPSALGRDGKHREQQIRASQQYSGDQSHQ